MSCYVGVSFDDDEKRCLVFDTMVLILMMLHLLGVLEGGRLFDWEYNAGRYA